MQFSSVFNYYILVRFVDEIFHDLNEEVRATAARGHGLMARVKQLERLKFLHWRRLFFLKLIFLILYKWMLDFSLQSPIVFVSCHCHSDLSCNH